MAEYAGQDRVGQITRCPRGRRVCERRDILGDAAFSHSHAVNVDVEAHPQLKLGHVILRFHVREFSEAGAPSCDRGAGRRSGRGASEPRVAPKFGANPQWWGRPVSVDGLPMR